MALAEESQFSTISEPYSMDEAAQPATGLKMQEAKMHQLTYARETLELLIQLMGMRVDYLNQLNTQSTLVAGSIVGMLTFSELDTFAEETGSVSGVSTCRYYCWFLQAIESFYIIVSTFTLASSLWVIYISMNLITLSTRAILDGASESDVLAANNLLESRRPSTTRRCVVRSLAGADACSHADACPPARTARLYSGSAAMGGSPLPKTASHAASGCSTCSQVFVLSPIIVTHTSSH